MLIPLNNVFNVTVRTLCLQIGLIDSCPPGFNFLAGWYTCSSHFPELSIRRGPIGDKKTKESRWHLQKQNSSIITAIKGLQALWNCGTMHTWPGVLGFSWMKREELWRWEVASASQLPYSWEVRDTREMALWITWSEASTCVHRIHRCHLSSQLPCP